MSLNNNGHKFNKVEYISGYEDDIGIKFLDEFYTDEYYTVDDNSFNKMSNGQSTSNIAQVLERQYETS